MSDKFNLKDAQGPAGERYAVVTCVSQFRQRYCIPVSELQKLNDNYDLTAEPHLAVEWAEECVLGQEVNEFSQHYMDELIVDTFMLDEERVLQLFDRDNDYLKDWSKEQKLNHIHNWKIEQDRAGISSPVPIEVDE